MVRLVAVITRQITSFHGWCVDVSPMVGSIALSNPEFADVEVYATPDWSNPNTLVISVESGLGEYIRSIELPVNWPANDDSVVEIWRATLERHWPQILKTVREGLDWQGGMSYDTLDLG